MLIQGMFWLLEAP